MRSVKQFCLSWSTISTGVVLELVEIGSRRQDLYKLIHRLWTCKCEGRQACSATAGKPIQFRSHTLETRMSIGDEQFMQVLCGRLSALLRTGVGHKNKTQISDDFARICTPFRSEQNRGHSRPRAPRIGGRRVQRV